jgi:hypothetical protein
MLEDDDIFGGLLGLREALAPYLGCGVALEPVTVAMFVATLDIALDAYETEKKERAFDELIRSGAAVLEKKRQRPIRAHIIAGPKESGMGAATIYQFQRRAPAPVSPSNGGDAA